MFNVCINTTLHKALYVRGKRLIYIGEPYICRENSPIYVGKELNLLLLIVVVLGVLEWA